MRYAFIEKIGRSRTISALAILALFVSITASSGAAHARVDSLPGSQASALDIGAVAKATGGGTVLVPSHGNAVASFGLNARRPMTFTGGGEAEGRINYVRHKNTAGRHVNVPVVLMQASPTPQPPNQTGGEALIIGECTPQATCPENRASVIVYVKDVADSGTNQDTFQIYFCEQGPGFPNPFIPGTGIGGCDGPEGGLLRSGNIQVRGDAAVAGETIGSAAGSGAYSSTPTLNGVELAGGRFGLGVRTAGPGDLEAQLNGVNPLIGLFQQITVTGWISSTSLNGSTITMSGTATLDMGDGAPPVSGLPLSATLTTSGVAMTIGTWTLPSLPRADGFINIE